MFRRKRNKSQQPRHYQQNPSNKQPVFSYSSSRKGVDRAYNRAENQDDMKSSKLTKASLLTRLQYAFVILIILGGLIYSLGLDSSAQIKVDGIQTFPRESYEYEVAVQKELNSSWLNGNKITLDREKLAQNIRRQFPEIQYVEVKTTPLRHKPVVTIQLAQPTARLITPGGSYVLDGEGRALFNANDHSAGFDISKLIPITDNSGHEVEIDKPAVTEEQINYIREVLGQFEKKSIPIKEMALASGGVELQVRPKDRNYVIKFSFYSDARQSSGAYFALRDDNIQGNQYIDLRIPDRAYIK